MNLIFDIDDTINNLTEYICKKRNIDIQKFNNYNMENSMLSKEEIKIISEEYDENCNYENCKYYLKKDLFQKLAENNVIVFYSKCIKNEHIEIKHKKIEEVLNMKVKKINAFNKNTIKNGIYFLPLCVEWFIPKPALELNHNDYIFEDSIENLNNYRNHILAPNKILMKQPFNKDIEKLENIHIIQNYNELYSLLEEINKITYKEIQKNKRIKKNKIHISKFAITFSLISLLLQFQNSNDLNIKHIVTAIIIYLTFQIIDDN